MNWPPASDYQDAIQNPALCFNDIELKSGHVALNKIGLPRVASGNFASVYEMQNAGHRWAVRCFLRQGEDQQNRYAQLSLYLSRLVIAGLVTFNYQTEGIRVRGKWYPIVKMDWVVGETLTTYVQKHLNQPEALRTLALQWRGLLRRLRQNRIAHGDLQHGNVLVSPQGALCLVDYDGMYVPTLQGQKSSELGHINYQHPRRSSSDFDERLDNFSALVIYTALIALSLEPGLWKRFDTGENMLFTAQDFREPAQSVLFNYLLQQPDPGLKALARALAGGCYCPTGQTPEFQSVIDGLTHGPLPDRWWKGAVPDAPHSPPAPPLATRTTPLPPSRSADPPAPLPIWMREPKIEVVAPPVVPPLPEPMTLPGSITPGIPTTSQSAQNESREQRRETVLERVQSWQSTSCLTAFAVMFGLGMLAEVAYEKVVPPRPTTHSITPTATPARKSQKKHPSPHRVPQK